MKELFISLKGKIASTVSSLLSVIGAGSSSAGAVCQTTCSTSSSVLPFLGLSLAATPFAFIEVYQLYIWWFAFSLFALTLWVSFKRSFASKFEQGLLFINAGLLTIGLPYLRNSQMFSLIVGLGIVLLIVGVFQVVKTKKFVIKFADQYETR